MAVQDYAPILIPTLCRYTHFYNCVESLKRNKGAEYTDLFIALDFPLKEEHWEGYNQINNYIAGLSGFKNIEIIRRNKNYGAISNIRDAREYILKRYDRYIFTEDDNLFSTNFLEYINKGFRQYENDKSIFAICGYSFYEKIPSAGNNFYLQDVTMYAWGYGIWRRNVYEFKNKFNRWYCFKKIINPITLFKVLRRSPYSFCFLVQGMFKSDFYNDNTMSLFLFLEKRKVVCPIINKVKNEGWDGTGIHCGITDKYSKLEIDKDDSFEFVGSGTERNKEVNEIRLKDLRSVMSYRKICFAPWILVVKLVRKMFAQRL